MGGCMDACMGRGMAEYHNKQTTAIKLVLFISIANTHEDRSPPPWHPRGNECIHTTRSIQDLGFCEAFVIALRGLVVDTPFASGPHRFSDSCHKIYFYFLFIWIRMGCVYDMYYH